MSKNSKLQSALLLAAAVVFTMLPARAHHSFAADFDSSKPLTLKGKVTRVAWTNPPVFLFMDVADRGGRIAHWRLESLAPNGLLREGWTKDAVKAGDTITVFALQAKDEENFAKTTAVILPGGNRVNTGYIEERGP